MEKITLKAIIKKYDIQDIEKQLVLQYLLANGINYSSSPFICKYLDGFEIDASLAKAVSTLNHKSIEELAGDMEILIPSSDKKVNGAFFTPSYIVDFIIETVQPQLNDKVIDFSCGSGAFLIGIIRYYQKKYNKTVSQCIYENIFGADILEYNTFRSKLLLTLYGLKFNEKIDVNRINIITCNSLNYDWKIKFDAVVGNPPYVKFQDMDENMRSFLLQNYQTTQHGTYNLYFAFFELGLKYLNSNGRLGYITPNNYFTSLSGVSLRSFFQSNSCVYKIVDFNSKKVFDVQTYTAITFLNKKQNKDILYARIEDQSIQNFLLKPVFSPNNYDDLLEKKWRLLCAEERENIYKIENCGQSIGSLFNICVGIATLKDEVFFIEPLFEDELYYYVNKYGADFKIEKNVTRPVIKISDMKGQDDVLNNKRKIIFPYIVDKNKSIPISVEEMEQKYPFCYNYLLSVKSILESRGKGKHKYSPFYAYGRSQGLNRKGIKLLTPTFSKYPRFLLDNDENSFFTNGYGIYLNHKESIFSNQISLPQNIDILQKVLNSCIMYYYISKTSVSIEGGYPCFQKNFIERFNIPFFSEEEINQLRKMRSTKDIDEFLINIYHLKLPLPNL